jgi:hypothetical protein
MKLLTIALMISPLLSYTVPFLRLPAASRFHRTFHPVSTLSSSSNGGMAEASLPWFEVGNADDKALREYHAGVSVKGKMSFTTMLRVPEIASMRLSGEVSATI